MWIETRLYKIWANMKYRCNTNTCHAYKNYGERGIKVCDEWNDYKKFSEWALNNGYEDNLTIDRIDRDGNYEPNNCQWIPKSLNTAKSNKDNIRRKSDKGKYYGISPSDEYIEFTNANLFAREHNLYAGLIRDMAYKRKYKNNTYRGWKFGFLSDLNE